MQPITVSTPYKSEQIHLVVAFNLLSQWQLLLLWICTTVTTHFPGGSLSETILTNKEGESLICNPFIVGRVGLEPTPLSGPDFESGASTSSAICRFLEHQARIELAPLGRKHNILPLNYWCSYTSACGRTWTANHRVTKPELCQLSYTGELCSSKHCTACGNLRQVLRSTLVKPMTLMGLPGLEPRSTD